jgi:hypothetical protein
VNQPTAILDRWTKPGDNAPIQALTTGYGGGGYGNANYTAYYFTTSSGAYSNGFYIRLRTTSLSYSLPAAFCKKIGIADSRFFINAQNLLLITRFKVGDPELSNLFSFPIQRTIALGITINL